MTEVDYIKSNGFLVDRNTGECVKEPYFNHSKFEQTPTFRFNERKFSLNPHWRRVLRVEKYTNQTFFNVVIGRFNLIMSLLKGKLSVSVSENLFRHIITKHPSKYIELYRMLFDYVYKYDLTVTTKELMKAITEAAYTSSNRNALKRFFKKISHVNIIRKYYWYINRQLNRLPLDNVSRTEIESVVRMYYDLIRFRMGVSYNPLNIIDYLIYHTVNQLASGIPSKFRTIQYHKCSNFKTQNSKKLFQIIIKKRLDNNFKFKLRQKYLRTR